MLLGFFYARPASALLLDEPDAHEHVFLQKLVSDRLRLVARNRRCQLVIATHSEVIIDNTSPERIMSFYGEPHLLERDVDREHVREALKRVSALDLLLLEEHRGVLYTESRNDLDCLREWARILRHEALPFLEGPLWHDNMGRHPREARAHFFALRAIRGDVCGALLLDGDNRGLPSHELSADGLTILRWKRDEVENDLIVPSTIRRFLERAAGDLLAQPAVEAAMEFLKRNLPPAAVEAALGDHDYLNVTAARKSILPQLFRAVGIPISADEYFQIAAAMSVDEIHPEIREKLDGISAALRLCA